VQTGTFDAVVVGADRIAANGDTANKIGTYTVAVLAAAHGVPFYVAAPLSTIDPACPTGESIPIEERSPLEVVEIAGTRVAPDGIQVRHPAFDVTPARLVSAIITERGVLRAPYEEAIRNVFND
ncbi:MAG: S-methyl-5-thioribose-1-phosphate isomerase, partial [Thermoanaerobaculia bacterium]